MDEATLHESHPEVTKRLRRANGHLVKVIGMLDAGRPCLDVAQQLHAVERAIGAAKKQFIHDHVDHCLDQALDSPRRSSRRVLGEFKAIARYL